MSINNNSSKYTRQRQSGWKLTINTGQYLALYENDEETDLRRIANLIADELENANQNPLLALIDANEELTGIIEDFRLVTDDVEELDDCLAEMYNWGDYYRIWFSPVLEAKAQTNDNDYDWRADSNVYPFDTVVVWPGTGSDPHDAPRGTTALDALLNSPELAFARKRLASWRKYNLTVDLIPLDAVDALAIALQAIDLLLVERDEAQKALIVAKLGRIPTSEENTIGTPENAAMHAVLGNPAPAQPSAPAVATQGNTVLGVLRQIEAWQGPDSPAIVVNGNDSVSTTIGALTGTTPPEAARAKLTPLEWRILKALSLGTILYGFTEGKRTYYQMTVEEWRWSMKVVTAPVKHLMSLGYIEDNKLTAAGRARFAEGR